MNTEPNTEFSIPSYTLAELIARAGIERQGIQSECIVHDGLHSHQPFNLPTRIEAFIIGIGIEGEAEVSINLHKYTLRKHSLFIVHPRSILQHKTSNGFRAHIIVIAPQLMQRIDLDAKQLLPQMLQLGNRPIINLSPEESGLLHDYLTLLGKEVQLPESDFSRNVVYELIAALLYKISDLTQRYLARHPEVPNPVHSRAEEYFKQFLELLGEHFRQERSVGFYAHKLCVTPKYLTTLIKRISSKSVSEWIDAYVILEAKTLLRFSDKSIQEIAYYLNFPNQSFFGSYFKRLTGQSPSQYKASKK